MTFPIPPAALSQHTAILGKTGSGKTSTGKLVVEHVAELGERVCILDPIKSDWWGLTSSADGKRAGLPFQVLGGPHGHVPLHDGAGAAIAELVATGALPLSIIDMADFGPGGQARFFVDFAPVLLRRMRGVLRLVVGEAHLFAPKERSGLGAENMSIHWAKVLATAGRSKGIRLVVETQSVQQLHNRVLGSCENMIAMRLTAPADQKPVIDWLKANAPKDVEAQIRQSLASLKTGTGWLCSGEAGLFERVAFPRIRTFDNSATPDHGDAAHQVVQAQVDQQQLRELIGTAVAEAEANDPKKLKAKIAELEEKLEGSEASHEDEDVAHQDTLRLLKESEQRGFRAGQAAQHHLSEGVRRTTVEQIGHRFEHLVEQFRKDIADTLSLIAPASSAPQLPVPIEPAAGGGRGRAVAPVQTRAAASPESRPAQGAAGSSLPAGQEAILGACIEYPNGLRNEQLSMFSGLKRSTRDLYVQQLQRAGLVERRDGLVVATPAGRKALPNRKPLPRGAALQDYWLQRLSGGERDLFAHLCRARGKEMDRDQLGELVGLKRSTRDLYLQQLGRRHLVIRGSGGKVRAAAELFE